MAKFLPGVRSTGLSPDRRNVLALVMIAKLIEFTDEFCDWAKHGKKIVVTIEQWYGGLLFICFSAMQRLLI